jgi:aspartyl-tRNA(Asn)/glutamyl-tRNA(Gln) amidotransferase subunit C
MVISLDEVRRVAHLAHLELDEASTVKFREQLEQILAYVDKLNELDTEGINPVKDEPLAGAGPRSDLPAPSLTLDETLSNAPDSGQGHFKVPRVLPG